MPLDEFERETPSQFIKTVARLGRLAIEPGRTQPVTLSEHAMAGFLVKARGFKAYLPALNDADRARVVQDP